ncbi:methylcrotonoyl-CoA carboxylase subunit alpha, mitochondrial [Orussus abietinus]|uniref:methylcrotonoyl-CoA carboxylase subunit alpha, mitochondrial n=1 Tax=Orussus abietinus TaxID=222816 RepID=UPI0006261854|nr:methylcrotonoyl-CoA carboxylase subunit alpha, mitochondrial [Orussus abietinus]
MNRIGWIKPLLGKGSLTSFPERDFSLGTALNFNIDKILIANRGEIACRITKTAKRLGVKVVAVYSDADRHAMHVNLADEAYNIGPAPSGQSYLRQDKIISIAKRSKCQAIHPGYGFLSENMEFAELCHKANIIFIGPPASAIRDMGIKSTSKALMDSAGVPIVKGYHGEDQSNGTLLKEAKCIGFPLMIKAIRGGGGKGMRIAMKEEDFLETLESARTESQKAFGDSGVLLEQYIAQPRHVEVQIFADKQGNVVHLFERDCSVQRRHQKIIEEAPAPGISKELRSELGAAAVRAAKAVGYVGAGTVEFIMDRNSHSFHFMEMNTRLQVEHPITEAITGTDLVEWQLRVAAGEDLPLRQEEIQLRGHAFEARIYAEDPRNGFLPGAGRLLHLTMPVVEKHIRVETGVRQNDEVSVHYDPMIAKLVVWGKDRDEALRVLRAKLFECNIVGLETNVEFVMDLCSHPNFQKGHVHTGFIDEHSQSLFPKFQVPSNVLTQAALTFILYEEYECLKSIINVKSHIDPFAVEAGFRMNNISMRTFRFNAQGEEFVIDVKYVEPEVYAIRVNKLGPWRQATGILTKKDNIMELTSEIDGLTSQARVVKINDELNLFASNHKWQFTIPKPAFISAISNDADDTKGAAVSPMPGVVEKIFAKQGDTVQKEDPLVVIVAMKMEYIIRAPSAGVVESVLCAVGESVNRNKLLVKLSDPVENSGGNATADGKPSRKLSSVARALAAVNAVSRQYRPVGERIVYPRNTRTLAKTPVTGGAPIREDVCMALRTLVFGSCAGPPKPEWARTGLTFRTSGQSMAFGLRAPRNSTRGFVTAVQAVMLKHYLFKGNKQDNRIVPDALLKPNHDKQVEVLTSAIAEIIWRCAGGSASSNPGCSAGFNTVSNVILPKAIVALPQETAYMQHGVQYFQDGLTETLHLFEFTSLDDLEIFVKRYLYLFQDEGGPGAKLLLYSAVLSRGLSKVRSDLEDSKTSILSGCPEEGPITVVMLALTGRASPHLHNGVLHVGDEDTYAVPQWGVLLRSEVGFLVYEGESQGEKQPGSRLKTPSLPIWMTLCLGHYGVLFNTNRELLRNYHAERRFDVQYYTCGGSHATLTVDTRAHDVASGSDASTKDSLDMAATPLEKLIHSKWQDAQIQWNGTPVL